MSFNPVLSKLLSSLISCVLFFTVAFMITAGTYYAIDTGSVLWILGSSVSWIILSGVGVYAYKTRPRR
jgi:uncharacterized PurR-regulated membrane protein YhhQ (DUF165 family)